VQREREPARGLPAPISRDERLRRLFVARAIAPLTLLKGDP